MSDLFTTSEIALATLGLAYHREQDENGRQLDVVVGGLGLGYTAEALLCDKSVGNLWVIEALQAIIDWHGRLLPLGEILCADPRCKFVCSDFFASARKNVGFDATQPGRRFDVILVDIDHAPDFHLAPENAGFYSTAGLSGLKSHLAENGVFGLWSTIHLRTAYRASAHGLCRCTRRGLFLPTYQDKDVTQTIYLAR